MTKVNPFHSVVFIAIAAFFLILTSLSSKAVVIFGCQNIDSAGVYFLNNDINNASTCFNISSSDVTLDCQGHVINGSLVAGTYGIIAETQSPYKLSNITIKNCTIWNWDTGIKLDRVNESVISNVNSFNNTNYGIHLFNSSYNNLSGIFVMNTSADSGIYLEYSSSNNLTNVTALRNLYNIYISGSSTEMVYFNILTGVNVSHAGSDGLVLQYASNNTITESVFTWNNATSGTAGIFFYTDASDNIVFGNRFIGNSYGVYFQAASSFGPNLLYNNFFNNTENFFFSPTDLNYWNTSLNCSAGPNIIGGDCIGGNYWGKLDGSGASDTCDDLDGNGICDSDIHLSGGGPQSNDDYLPLAPDDNVLPNVTLNYPVNESTVGTKSVTFNCSAMDNRALLNITLWGNWSGGWHANDTKSVSGTSNSTTFAKTLLNETYEWNCLACDTYDNCNWSAINYTFSVNTTVTTIVLVWPANKTAISSGLTINFTFNVTGTENISNCTLVLDGVKNVSNQTSVIKSWPNIIYQSLPKGIHSWGINCTEVAGTEKASGMREITSYHGTPPTMTKFTGKQVGYGITDYANVSGFWLENATSGIIEWLNCVNISGQDLDSNIAINYNLVGVFAQNLNSTLNGTANLTIKSLPYKYEPIIYRDGMICPDCTLQSYASGTLMFQVTGFSNYTAGANSNLTIWDETDQGMPGGGKTRYVGEQVYFFANYTNKTNGDPINGSGVYCNISFNVSPFGPFNMTFNSSASMYQYNRTFASPGMHHWNVSCNGSLLGYEELNVSDTVNISMSNKVISCGVLNQSNMVYVQNANIIADKDPCINITAMNVTFDGNGKWIRNTSLAGTGIYSNQLNTTIRGCNVTMNDSYPGFGIELNGANNSCIHNNTLNFQVIGLYSLYVDNVKIANNTANYNYYGFMINLSSRVTATNNTGNSNAKTVWGSGIILLSSTNNTIKNNDVNSNVIGIFLDPGVNNSVIKSNRATLNYHGIILKRSSSNNTVTNNTAYLNSYNGIFLTQDSDRNTIANNTIDSHGRRGVFVGTSSYNLISGNTIRNCSTNDYYACIEIDESDYNVFDGNVINKSYVYGVWIHSNDFGDHSSNNVFSDMLIMNIDNTSVVLQDNASSQNLNNTFLNCTYNNESVDSGSQLIRKWYYMAYVNDTNGNNVSDAAVRAFNASGVLIENLTTGSAGWTPMGSLIEYVNSGGSRQYYSNYTVNASKTAYITDSNEHNMTISHNIVNDNFQLSQAGSGANLTIWDETDPSMPGGGKTKYMGENVYFFANYTNKTNGDPINGSGVYCNISFDDSPKGPFGMTFNITDLIYHYNRSFSISGTRPWNVSCNGSVLGFEVLNATDTVNISSLVNNPPDDPAPGINSTDGSNTTSQDLNCFSTITDPDADSINVTVKWYRNLALNMSADYNNSYANGTFFNAVLGSGNTSAGENWSCGMMLHDGQDYSNSTNSSGIHILSAPGNITGCQPLNTPGVYILRNHIANWSAGNCFVVTVSNVTLDCLGHIVDGNVSSNTYGILAAGTAMKYISNITVRSCNIYDWYYGISYEYVKNGIISNTTSYYNNWRGVNLKSSSYNNLTNITASFNDYYGIRLTTGSANNFLGNITANNNTEYGIGLFSASGNNTLIKIKANDNDIRGIDLTASSHNNLTGITANGNTFDGIYLKSSSHNNLTGITASSNDNCGIRLTTGSDSNLLANATADHNINHGILISYSSNNNLTEIAASKNNNSICVNYSSNGNIMDDVNASFSSYDGIYIDYYSSDNIITNGTVTHNNRHGIHIGNSSNNTVRSSKILMNSGHGIHLVGAGHYGPNKIYDNFLNNTNNTGFSGTVYGNYWNTSKNCSAGLNIINGSCMGGNYWAQPDGQGHSQMCVDGNGDGICSAPEYLAAGNTDFLPLTPPSNESGCMNITSPGVILLNGSLNASGTCFNISSSHVIIDCQGHSIVGTQNWDTYGVIAHGSSGLTNITIKSCNISSFYIGIEFDNVDFSVISDTMVFDNYFEGIFIMNTSHSNLSHILAVKNEIGIRLEESSSNNLTNITSIDNDWDGLFLSWNSSFNNLTEIVAFSNAGCGVRLSWFSNDNDFTSVIADSNNGGGFELWDCLNNDLEYLIAQNNSHGVVINNCNSSKIAVLGISNSTSDGLDISYSTGNVITGGNIFNSSGYGMYLSKSYNNTFFNLSIENSSMGGTYLFESGKYGPYYDTNLFYDNHFRNDRNYESSIMGYMNDWNTTLNCSAGPTIVGGPCMGGNFWGHPNGSGFSERCIDGNRDGICGYPLALDSSNIDYLPLTFPGNVTGCMNITSPGVYYLNNSVNSTGTCFGIETSDIIFDCQWNEIEGYSATYTYGILAKGLAASHLTNVTIKNCNLTHWYHGMLFEYVDYSAIFNTNSYNNSQYGIELKGSSNNTIKDIKSYCQYFGIHITGISGEHSSGNYLSGASVWSNTAGIVIGNQCDGNTMDGINASNSIWGITATSNYNTNITNSTIDGNTNDGIRLDGANDAVITKNNISLNTNGIRLVNNAGSMGPNVIYNNLFNNTKNAFFSGTFYVNEWNATLSCIGGLKNIIGGPCIGGNYWGYPNGTGFSDNCSAQTNGVCDHNYTMNSLNVDFLPIVLSWSSAEFDYWNLTNYTTGAPLGIGAQFMRNHRLNASAHWIVADNITHAIVRHNGNGTFRDYEIPGPYAGNWTNYTLDLSNVTEFERAGNVTVDHILVQVGLNSNQTSPPMWFLLWGNASVSSATLDYDAILNGTGNTIRCNVTDSHSSAGLGGYNVSFFMNDTFIGSNFTDTNGRAVYSFIDSTDGEADYTMKCNITDQAGLYYNASSQNEQTASLQVIEMQVEASVSDTLLDFGDSVDITAIITTDMQNTVDSAWANITYSDYSANVSQIVTLAYTSLNETGDYRYWNYSYSGWDPPRSGDYDVQVKANLSSDGRRVSAGASFHVSFGHVSVYFAHQNYRILVNQTFNYTVNITAVDGDLLDINATFNSTDNLIINVSGISPPKYIGYLLNGSTASLGWRIETLSAGITRMAIDAVPGNGTNITSLMSHDVILPKVFPVPENASVDTAIVFNVYVGGNVSDVGSVSLGVKKEFAGYTEDYPMLSNGSANESYCFGPAGSGNVASLSHGGYANCTMGSCNLSINEDNEDYWTGVGGGGEQWLEIVLNKTYTISILEFLWSRSAVHGNPNISVHYRESDTHPWIQVLGNLSAPEGTKAWENMSGFTPFKAKRIKINFSESGVIKIFEFRAITPSGVEGLCYLYVHQYQDTNMSGNHSITGHVHTGAGNASVVSGFFLEYGTITVNAYDRVLINGTTNTYLMARIRALGGDARNVSVNLSFGNSSLVNISSLNPVTFDFLPCEDCSNSVFSFFKDATYKLQSINIGAANSTINANSTTGRGVNGTDSASLQVILVDPYPPEISGFHYQYGCSGQQSPISRANLHYDACAWIEIVENLTGVKEANVSVTFPDDSTYTGMVMDKYNESGNLSWWTMSFYENLPLNATGEYNMSIIALDYGDNNVTTKKTKDGNNTLNVTDVYTINFTNNHSVFNRGENLTFEAIDVNNYTIVYLNWTINVTINGTRNITNSTDNPYVYLIGIDKEGPISIELDASGNGNNGSIRSVFIASKDLLPVFVQPPPGSEYAASSGIFPIPQVRVYNARSELLDYLAYVNLSCPNNDFTLGRVEDLYYNVSADCRSRSSPGGFSLYAYAADALKNSGTGQLSLTTESDGTGGPGDSTPGPSSPGIGIAPVVNCTNLCEEWVDVACGLGNCTREQIYQKRECEVTTDVCPAERCVYSDLCLEKIGFDFELSEDEVTIKRGEDFKVRVSANNTGNVRILINISSASSCTAVTMPAFLELEEGNSADFFMDVHVPLSEGAGECEANVTFLSGVSRRTRGLKVIVAENELIQDMLEYENRLADIETQILGLLSSGIDVSGLLGLKAGAVQSRDNAKASIVDDDLAGLQTNVRNLGNFISEIEAAMPALMIFKFALDYRYYLAAIIVFSLLISYLLSQVLLPSSRLGKEISELAKRERELVQTRVSTEKQYFKRQIDENTFNNILMKKQEEILRTRGLLITKRKERSMIINQGMSARAMLGWLVAGPRRLAGRLKSRQKEKKDTGSSMA